MKILNSYKKIAKEFIKEAEVDDDKIIKYKDKEGESQEMTAGAAKKQPEDHPAKQAYNKMKGDGDSGDKPKGKALGGSDFDRDFDDEPTDKGDGTHTSSSKIDSKFPEFELEEEPFEADDYDEEMENEITDEITAHFSKNGEDEEMADLVRDESEKLVAKYQDPDGVPNEKRNMKAYRDDLIKNVYMAMGEKDAEAGFDADDDGGPSGDEEPKKISSDEIDKKVDDLGKEIFSIYHSGMSPQDKERYIDSLQKQIDDLKSQKESIKVINGKKYKAIKESKEPTKPTIHSFKETYKKIGGK